MYMGLKEGNFLVNKRERQIGSNEVRAVRGAASGDLASLLEDGALLI